MKISFSWITRKTFRMDSLIGLFLLFSALGLINCNIEHDDKLKLIPNQSEYVKFVNNTLFVTCVGNRTRWIKPNGKLLLESRGRVHIEPRNSNNLGLIFERITHHDNGTWTCFSEEDNVHKNFTMHVFEQISFESADPVQKAREDKDAIIHCKVKGTPTPEISWDYKGQPLEVITNGKMETSKYKKLKDGLMIKKVARNNSGEYTCKAFQISSSLANHDERTIRLVVEHKPISRKIKTETVFGYLRGSVNLSCEAEAEPPADFHWFHHHKRLQPRAYPIYIAPHISYLQIYIQTNESFGEYRCVAKNAVGEVDHIIHLREGIKPEMPKQFLIRGFNSDTLDVDVGAKKDPKSNNIMETNGYRFEIISVSQFESKGGWETANQRDFNIADGVTYLLTNLKQDTEYYVRVAARNLAGLSDWTPPMKFRTSSIQPHKNENRTTSLLPSLILILFSFLLTKTN